MLKSIPCVPNSPWVIPGRVEGRQMRNIDEAWGVVCELAGLTDTRNHDLRHCFASFAVASGPGLPMIGKLLGHTQIQITARHAHLATDPVWNAADGVGKKIGKAMC